MKMCGGCSSHHIKQVPTVAMACANVSFTRTENHHIPQITRPLRRCPLFKIKSYLRAITECAQASPRYPRYGVPRILSSIETMLDKLCVLISGVLQRRLNYKLICVVVLFFISPVSILIGQTSYIDANKCRMCRNIQI